MPIAEPIRVALVGAGGMARNYRAVYARLETVKWVLAVDPDEEALDACRALGVQRTSSRFEDALADDIDLVDISTPNALHEAQAVAALAAGKHVLLQKPMANSLDAADRIVVAARDARGRLGMYMSSYANPLVWEIKRIVDARLLGEIQSVRARDAHRGGLGATGAGWRASREQTGGGSFVQLSIHAINLMQWWTGRRISEVSAYSANQHCPNIGGDDVTVAIARFGQASNAILGTFDSGYASEGQTREIYGTRGWIRLDDHNRVLHVRMDAAYEGPVIRYATPGEACSFAAPGHRLDDVENPFNPHRQFIERLRDGRQPLMGAADGRQDLAVVMAAYESARSARRIAVK